MERDAWLVAVAGVVVVVLVAGVLVFAVNAAWTDRARVVVRDGQSGAVLGTVSAEVADTALERYRGLSGTDSLDPGTGMWFVFEEAGIREFVMRGMQYDLDMVFVGANGTVTAVFHATVGSDRVYSARAKWVLEVPAGWAEDHGVGVGDEVRAT